MILKLAGGGEHIGMRRSHRRICGHEHIGMAVQQRKVRNVDTRCEGHVRARHFFMPVLRPIPGLQVGEGIPGILLHSLMPPCHSHEPLKENKKKTW